MQIADHNEYTVHHHGAGRFGVEYVICQYGRIVHRGSREFIRWKWRKLTGKDF